MLHGLGWLIGWLVTNLVRYSIPRRLSALRSYVFLKMKKSRPCGLLSYTG
jgi:hypothetical protein